VRQFVQPLCETDLSKDLESRRVNRVAAKVAVEISVCLEQRHPNAGAHQEK
jgi:hypothetical protein